MPDEISRNPDASKLLDLASNPPFDLHRICDPPLLAEKMGGIALSRLLNELPSTPITQDVLTQTAVPAQAKRIIEAIPFLKGLSDALATKNHGLYTIEMAYPIGSCVAAFTLESAVADINRGIFEKMVLERAEELERTQAKQYKPEDRQDVLLEVMCMRDDVARRKTVETFLEDLEDRIEAADLPAAAKWADHYLRHSSDVKGGDDVRQSNTWSEVLASSNDGFEVIHQMLEESYFAAKTLKLLGSETMSDSGKSPAVQFTTGVNRILAFVTMGIKRLADLHSPGAA